MAFADKAGIPDGGSPRWHIPLADEQLQMARGHKERLGEYAVICPSASSADRTWTIENYQQIAVYLSNLGYPVVLVGGPHESEREIADLIENCGHVKLNLVGETSLKELLAVLKEARLVIAPDTGPAHMATAAGTDVIGLYAHSNPRRTGPYNNIPQVVSIYEDVIQEQKGKPWQKLPWGTRAKGWNLMCRISVDAVKKKIDKILKTD
jgi:heptosyltransferase I